MSTSSQGALSGNRIWVIRFVGLGWLALATLLAFCWGRFVYDAYLTVGFPGQIDYGEGIVWQQAALIPGPRMYGDVQAYPFLVLNYPPIYHLVVHALASLGAPWLMTGRLVSIASTFGLAALLVAFVMESIRRPGQPILSRPAALAGALAAGLLLVTLRPIQDWAYTMRIDLLAIALEFLGMYLALRSLRQPALAFAAALVFVLAVYTKQTVIAGAAASFAVLLVHTPARALRAALFAVLVGGVALAVLTLVTHGGFPRHIIVYNVNRFSFRTAYEKLFAFGILRDYPLYLSIATAMAATLIVRHWGRLREMQPGHAIILLYFLLSTVSLLSLGKSGAANNYMIPWVCSWAVLIGLALVDLGQKAEQEARALPLLALLALLIVQASVTPAYDTRRLVDPQVRREYAELVAMTRRATKPVFSEDMVVVMQAGKEVPWEPAIITELTTMGMFDERKIISMIEAHDLAFAVVTGNMGVGRYTPTMRTALMKAFPVERSLAGERVLLPVESN